MVQEKKKSQRKKGKKDNKLNSRFARYLYQFGGGKEKKVLLCYVVLRMKRWTETRPDISSSVSDMIKFLASRNVLSDSSFFLYQKIKKFCALKKKKFFFPAISKARNILPVYLFLLILDEINIHSNLAL